jgi:phenylacetate-CoA ligase
MQLLSLLRSQWWDAEKIRAFQERALVDMLRYATTHVPYYQSLGIEPGDINRASDLEHFPVLTKQDIQALGEQLRSPEFESTELNSSVTSGSSGEPTTTWFDPDSWLLCKFALKFRRTLLGGSPFGQRLMILSDARVSPDKIPSPRRFNRIAYSELHVSLYSPVARQLEALLDFRPTMIYGSPSVLRHLCSFAAEHGIDLPPVRTIFLSSEFVSAALRWELETAFSGRVIDIYGSTEFKEIAWQCTHGRYHVNFESVFLESTRTDGNDEGLLVTTLANRAMPLIRFDIGDYASVGTKACACGRQSPWLHDIRGRRVEYLELRDGRSISPYLLTTNIETVPGLRQYQLVQRSDHSIELRVAFGSGCTNGKEDRLRSILERLIGHTTPVRVKPVDTIQRSASGKHHVVVREV